MSEPALKGLALDGCLAACVGDGRSRLSPTMPGPRSVSSKRPVPTPRPSAVPFRACAKASGVPQALPRWSLKSYVHCCTPKPACNMPAAEQSRIDGLPCGWQIPGLRSCCVAKSFPCSGQDPARAIGQIADQPARNLRPHRPVKPCPSEIPGRSLGSWHCRPNQWHPT